MFPILPVGRLAIQLPGLIRIIGILIGINIAEKHAVYAKISKITLDRLFIICIICGMAGARIAFFLRFPSLFLKDPFSLLSLNLMTLDFEAGVLIAIFAGLVFGQREKLSFWRTMDAFTPLIAVYTITMPVANLASGDGYGLPASLNWCIYLWGVERHPTQLYELLSGICVMAVIYPGGTLLRYLRGKFNHCEGVTFLLFLSMTIFMRVFLLSFRGDQKMFFGQINLFQLVGWIILAICLWLLDKKLS